MNGYPMETAPRDGTWILLCGGRLSERDEIGPDGEFGYHLGLDDKRPVVARWEDSPDILGGAWVYAWWDGNWGCTVEDPTSWLPLPKQGDTP